MNNWIFVITKVNKLSCGFLIGIFDIDIFNEIYIFLFNEIYIKFFVNGNIYDLFDNRAKQQCGFSISRRSTLNTQSVHKASKSIIVEIHPNNTIKHPNNTWKQTKYSHFKFWSLQSYPNLRVNFFNLFYDTFL